jgi:alpha-mannosidase
MDTRASAGAVPLLVYNPLSAAREDVVEAEVALPPGTAAMLRVTGPDGKETPSQLVSVADGRAKILFLAAMPSCGFAVYAVQADPASGNAAKGGELKVSLSGLENARYRVTLDAAGDIASIFDKAAGRELLAAPARLELLHEKPRDYPSWNMDWADRQKPPRAHVTGTPAVKVVEDGPARVALEVTRKMEDSTFVQTIRLAAGGAGDRVEVACRIDWRGKETALKAAFPLTVSNPEATYNWEFGTIRRGNNDPKKYEVPSHQWFDLTAADGSYGVTVLEDSKYGSDKPDDSTLRLTLLYTPGAGEWYGHGATQDWGRHEMLYALAGHRGSWNDAGTPWIAARLNNPLLPFAVPAHPGRLGRRFALLSVEGAQVAACALKQAEESGEVVVRLHELYGRPAKDVRVSFPGGAIREAREVNGQEQPLGPAVVRDGCLVADFGPYQPRAFALKLGEAPAAVPAPVCRTVRLPYDEDVMSLDGERNGGDFDGSGNALAGEMLPEKLAVGGVEFALGSPAPGRRNAVACRGQTIRLPADGRCNRVCILAAASGGDTHGTFTVGKQASLAGVQDWGGYVGQWDCRVWKGDVPEVAYRWDYALEGIRPGFIKRDEVAWFCSHRHVASGANDPYAYSYLYVHRLPVAPGSRTLTLPYNPAIHVLAVTLVREPHDEAVPARPLYDTLQH